MNGRQRLAAALDHREPDRPPVDFGGTAVTGMHVAAVAALREHYGLEKKPVKVIEPYQMLGEVDGELKSVLGIDVEGVQPPETMFGFANENWKEWRLESGQVVLVSGHFRTRRDADGGTLIYPGGDLSAPASGRMPRGGFFFDTIIRQEPEGEEPVDPEAAGNLEEFKPISDSDLDYFAAAVACAAATGLGVAATFGGMALGDIALVPAPFLKRPRGIRDIEEWYVSPLKRPDYVRRIFERQTEIALQNLEKIHARVGDAVDAVFVCGTDFGTQQTTFIPLDILRDLWLPHYRQINGWIHAHTAWKTFKHSCGAVESFIAAFIESGFDILNPVQCSARGMEPRRLKEKYGARIVFWGGGVDTQTTLMFGTPEDVRRQVLERAEIFGRGGGFVFNAVHNVQANTPRANLVALFDAVREMTGIK